MKGLKILLAGVLAAPMLTACVDDKSGSFPVGTCTREAYGVIYIGCTNDWRMTMLSGSDWCKPQTMEGKSNLIYTIPVEYAVNKTHEGRTASFHAEATDNSDVKWEFVTYQYATRGDGSYGDAPLVGTIDGSDGSQIEISYDNICRPTKLVMTKDGTTLRNMTFAWTDSTLTINNSLTGNITNAYQPADKLMSETDTVLYTNIGTDYQKNVYFNVEDHRRGEYSGQGLYFARQAGNFNYPDNDRQADSLRYYHRYADGSEFQEAVGVKYSDSDNRMQSVDVNQLLFGIRECSPYQLVGLFRRGRSTKIMSEATSALGGSYKVEAQLNSDKSVRQLTVTDKQGGKVTYTFSYVAAAN